MYCLDNVKWEREKEHRIPVLHFYVQCTSKLWARKGLWNRFQDSWWAVATPLVYNRPISLCSADVPLLIRKIIQLATRDTYESISPRRGKWSQCSIFFYYFWALLWPNGLIWFEVWEIMVLQIIITIIPIPQCHQLQTALARVLDELGPKRKHY